jgi:hypothetical protein
VSIICRKETHPVFGSGLSKSRLVDISKVAQVPHLALSTDCLVIGDVYFCLLPEDRIMLKGGTSHLLVPSGNFFEEDPCHLDSCCLASCARSAAHSKCMAYTLEVLAESLFLFEPSMV